ncbi:zinc ABC transporter substrate-binding protein [Halorubrum ezzemoulense]|uniref:metal ABC transporter solute-binding protein, Zn/Mn family n=1 Tax=Halorubrum ezzemoulense TaxID=337243 RepID=UPI00232C867D|nr:zinc ABC transporter substrate-binding protein [Halorubrum ezzemoulense]MDB2260722.1 zinc ABC transporter substrate-binding protein [Halorubrum ezzemoulense]MDB2268006.1 zinc ABC transporter substrate-binding protein [Halorubrum ezzemoulense]MDB9247976.1 zinc ABC transporter substrate-binding protein [Halorubrum ezzemoulense]MDB9258115.1 zinc ABC transporter substrate-binding protein [Halorubrum ezzemoulense]MDB9261523.1 zinc ABC transporter substrate-binding protein [Halorubrum ezzemoulens
MTHSRRSVLRRGAGLAVAGTAASLAGCAGNGGGGSEGFDSGYAAFFTLNDWANEVAGDNASFEDPVDVGQLGHGWTPDGTLAADVAATDAFVYLDSPEFAWAQDLAATLESDYDTVATVDVLDGLEGDLLEWNHSHGESHDEEGHDEGDHDGEGHDEGDHDNGTRYDPHVWTDPVLAAEMVDTIATGLGEADPDNAEAYAANAEAYAADLDAIDDAFRSIAEDAARDVAVLAGHNSFQYLEARYGFRLRSPVGVSPQNEPTQSEIADTIDLVDAEGIDVVLYDRFQSPRLAESIVENSGAAEAVPVTPAGGTTREWNDAGYGYLEQMTEINVPAFERAFGAQ